MSYDHKTEISLAKGCAFQPHPCWPSNHVFVFCELRVDRCFCPKNKFWTDVLPRPCFHTNQIVEFYLTDAVASCRRSGATMSQNRFRLRRGWSWEKHRCTKYIQGLLVGALGLCRFTCQLSKKCHARYLSRWKNILEAALLNERGIDLELWDASPRKGAVWQESKRFWTS